MAIRSNELKTDCRSKIVSAISLVFAFRVTYIYIYIYNTCISHECASVDHTLFDVAIDAMCISIISFSLETT